MEIKESIGMRIKELRQSRHLSQESLAERVGISSKYLSSIERGKENPTLDTLIKLSMALNVELSDMFSISYYGKTAKELKAFISNLLKDSDDEKLRLMARVVKAIQR
jgi:transcriptional regulator with XRE-family HTH domain